MILGAQNVLLHPTLRQIETIIIAVGLFFQVFWTVIMELKAMKKGEIPVENTIFFNHVMFLNFYLFNIGYLINSNFFVKHLKHRILSAVLTYFQHILVLLLLPLLFLQFIVPTRFLPKEASPRWFANKFVNCKL